MYGYLFGGWYKGYKGLSRNRPVIREEGFPVVRIAVGIGVGSIEDSMRGVISKQQLFDGKKMGGLTTDSHLLH